MRSGAGLKPSSSPFQKLPSDGRSFFNQGQVPFSEADYTQWLICEYEGLASYHKQVKSKELFQLLSSLRDQQNLCGLYTNITFPLLSPASFFSLYQVWV